MSVPHGSPGAKNEAGRREYRPVLQILMERQHAEIVNSMGGKPFHSPVKSPRHILEVGCGLGIASCHLGNLFPLAEVTGVDRQLLDLPSLLRKPSNVTLIQGDIHVLAFTESQLAWASQDFIYSRLIMVGMTDWKGYIEMAFQLLRPGGYLEVQEEDFEWYIEGKSITRDWQWWKVFYYGQQLRVDYDCAKKAATWMEQVGFEDVQVKIYRWPWGDWLAKEGHSETLGIGMTIATSHIDIYRGNLSQRAQAQGYGDDVIAELQAECTRTLATTDVKKYKEFYVTWGRKPLLGQSSRLVDGANQGMGGSS